MLWKTCNFLIWQMSQNLLFTDELIKRSWLMNFWLMKEYDNCKDDDKAFKWFQEMVSPVLSNLLWMISRYYSFKWFQDIIPSNDFMRWSHLCWAICSGVGAREGSGRADDWSWLQSRKTMTITMMIAIKMVIIIYIKQWHRKHWQ